MCFLMGCDHIHVSMNNNVHEIQKTKDKRQCLIVDCQTQTIVIYFEIDFRFEKRKLIKWKMRLMWWIRDCVAIRFVFTIWTILMSNLEGFPTIHRTIKRTTTNLLFLRVWIGEPWNKAMPFDSNESELFKFWYLDVCWLRLVRSSRTWLIIFKVICQLWKPVTFSSYQFTYLLPAKNLFILSLAKVSELLTSK